MYGLATAALRRRRHAPSGTSTGCRSTCAPAQFDAFLLRPLSALGQLLTSDFSLRRLGRVATGVVVLVDRPDVRRHRLDAGPARAAARHPGRRSGDLQRGVRRHLRDRLLAGRGHGVRQRLHLRRQLPVAASRSPSSARCCAGSSPSSSRRPSSPTCRPWRCSAAPTRWVCPAGCRGRAVPASLLAATAAWLVWRTGLRHYVGAGS